MRSTITSLISVAAISAAAITLAMTPTANADSIGVRDAADIDHGVDLRSVEVAHDTDDIVVTTTHANLRRSFRSGASGAVYLDTDGGNRGPEFVFVGGYFVGTDYQLLHTDGFGSRKWGKPVMGSYRLTLDYADEQVRMRVSRATLDSPERVRVAVRVSGKGQVDWLGEARSFSEWVSQ